MNGRAQCGCHVNLLSGKETKGQRCVCTRACVRVCVGVRVRGAYLSINMQIDAGASLRYPIRLSPQQGV